MDELDNLKLETDEFWVCLSDLGVLLDSYAVYCTENNSHYQSLPVPKSLSAPTAARGLGYSPNKQMISSFEELPSQKSDVSDLSVFYFSLADKQEVTLSLDQQDQRRFGNSQKCLLSFVRITVAKLTADNLLFVDSRLCALRSVFLSDLLPAGEYLIFVEVYRWSHLPNMKSTEVTHLSLISRDKVSQFKQLKIPPALCSSLEHLVWTDFALHNISSFDSLPSLGTNRR